MAAKQKEPFGFGILEGYEKKKFGEQITFSLSARLSDCWIFSRLEVTSMEDKPDYWKTMAR
jgi:hypothetical protein